MRRHPVLRLPYMRHGRSRRAVPAGIPCAFGVGGGFVGATTTVVLPCRVAQLSGSSTTLRAALVPSRQHRTRKGKVFCPDHHMGHDLARLLFLCMLYAYILSCRSSSRQPSYGQQALVFITILSTRLACVQDSESTTGHLWSNAACCLPPMT